MTVHVFGSINIDQIYRVPHLVRPGETLSSLDLQSVLGGKGANQSVALARAGAAVAHLGRIGEADAHRLETLSRAGVDIDGVERVAGTSGHAIIQVDDGGENAIVLHGGANRGFDRAALQGLLGGAREGDWLLMQNECDGLQAAFDIAAERGLRIAFNPAPMHATVVDLPLEHLALLIVNETEAAMLCGLEDGPIEAAALARIDAALAERCPHAIRVLTLGGRGAQLATGSGTGTERFLASPPPVEVVDTTGAGDTFTGFLLAALVAGLPAEQALRRAVVAGSLAVSVSGATPSIPSAAAVDAALDAAPNTTSNATPRA